MSTPVIISDYDSNWPALYAAERARLLEAIGAHLVAIEHVGSTSVPGLSAKPVIDIILGVRRLGDAPACIAPLAALGYEYRPGTEVSFPQRRYFRKMQAGRHTHHLHMVELTGDFWRRQILFRDYLRAHPGEAAEYDRLKRRLAAQYGADRAGYTDAKTAYIMDVEAKARTAAPPPTHETFIRRAVEQAQLARAAGDEPFGAILTLDGVVVYETPNRIFSQYDITAHAEMTAIREYCAAFNRLSLPGYTLYASAEPCPMCAGAIHWARISKVVYSVSQAMLQRLSGGTLKPSCAHAINAGSKPIEIIGPLLPEEGLRVFEGYTFVPKQQSYTTAKPHQE
ncbi:MAG: GrpB family protein [Anaerolineae bacterium]|nr:GrpB family protein [Anaerolineae bacterium]